jgi:hypothetical protein
VCATGHDGNTPRIDIENMARLAHCDSVMLMDDATTSIIRKHWSALKTGTAAVRQIRQVTNRMDRYRGCDP